MDFSFNKIICHRGIFDNKEIYENTLESFKLALKLNLPIEIDLRLLKDGNIVVFHDENCKRLINYDHDIEKMTYDELNYIAKYHVPLLEETLNLIDGQVPLLIELKTKKSKKNIFINKILKCLDSYKGPFAIQSYYSKHLKYIKKINSNIKIGLLLGKRKEHNLKRYDFINVKINLFDDKMIRKLKENIEIYGYTINNKEEFLFKKDVYDSLICNNVLDILAK